jgi:5-methylthioribose kinase
MELSEKNAALYLESRGILAHRVTELGGGISNVVLLVDTGDDSFILKQSLSQLRVKDQWLADRSRIFREMESLIDAASILPEGSVPEVLWADRANYLFAMTAVRGLCWKNELMAGRIDSAIAARAGSLLGCLISETWASDVLRAKYGDLTAFEQLRIDPYYRTIAVRHPDVRAQVLSVIEEMGQRTFCLVHGDFSPKNILISGDRVALIDFEVVHFGDPSFDAAFCLSLLLLGWFYQPALRKEREQVARAFFDAVRATLPAQAASFLEIVTLRHLGCLMLARIDGKSPVEYLPEESIQNQVRVIAKDLILRCPETLEECLERTFGRHDSKPLPSNPSVDSQSVAVLSRRSHE